MVYFFPSFDTFKCLKLEVSRQVYWKISKAQYVINMNCTWHWPWLKIHIIYNIDRAMYACLNVVHVSSTHVIRSTFRVGSDRLITNSIPQLCSRANHKICCTIELCHRFQSAFHNHVFHSKNGYLPCLNSSYFDLLGSCCNMFIVQVLMPPIEVPLQNIKKHAHFWGVWHFQRQEVSSSSTTC